MSLNVLRWILGASIVSTAIHFTHNFVEIDQYPQSTLISNTAVQIGIVVLWPLLTAVGLAGYRRYAAGRYESAHLLLATYAVLPLTTLGHYTEGNPDIAPFFYATIVTDGLLGIAMLAFVVRSAQVTRRRSAVTV
jgi:hypothetical protein